MRKLFLPLIAVLVFITACSSEPSFTVKVKVIGDNVDGLPVHVAMLDGVSPREVDSTVVKRGAFKIKGKLKTPDFFLVYIGDNGPMELFLENSDITVECRLDSLSEAKVQGSASHDLFVSFFDGLEPLVAQLQKVRAGLTTEGVGQLEEQTDSIYLEIERINLEMKQNMMEFFKKNNNSVVSPFMLIHTLLNEVSVEELQEIVDGFGPDIQESPHTINVTEQLELKKRTMIGVAFTDFAMADTLGVAVSLSDYVGKGKYVLMDVWAAWCAPCRMANPSLVALYNKYKSKNFEIVGVSLDREAAEWRKGIRDDELPWPQMSDVMFWQSEVVKLYNIESIPYAVLFDPEGNILYNHISVDQMDGILKELLDNSEK